MSPDEHNSELRYFVRTNSEETSLKKERRDLKRLALICEGYYMLEAETPMEAAKPSFPEQHVE